MSEALSFFQRQFKETGLTQEDNEVEVFKVDGEEWKTILHIYSEINKVFEKDRSGKMTDKIISADMKIQYPDLYGGVYTYFKKPYVNPKKKDAPTKEKEDGKENWFYRTRLEVPTKDDEGKARKYNQPSGSGIIPFFNKKIILAFQSETTIDTLYLIEGEKKSSRMCAEGFYAVGLMGFTAWRQGKGNPSLHDDIKELILKCKVKKVVLLTDADTMTITYDEKKNLAQRPNLFYSNVADLRNAMTEFVNSERFALEYVYFSYLRPKNIEENAKGVDDLLNLYQPDELPKDAQPIEKERYSKAVKKREEHLKAVCGELTELTFGGRYFQFHVISHGQAKDMISFFGLKNENEFYKFYGEFIGIKEFNFKGIRYQLINDSLIKIKHHDTQFYCYVHDTLYKKVTKINAKGKASYSYKIIREPFVKNLYKDYSSFLDEVPRYESFCVKPDNTEKYQQVVDNAFNLYLPITHRPILGQWNETYGFFKHLFRGVSTIKFNQDGTWIENFVEGDSFALMMDWLTVLLQMPLEKLPVPCLYSPENGTGKSTFMHLIEAVLGDNGTVLGNEEFLMSFNAHYITKAFVGLDEAMIEKEVEKERLKKMVTAKSGYLQFKGKDMEKIDFFAKFIFCTNKPNFMKVEAEESRWYVLQVYPFDKLNQKANILDDYLMDEVPALMYYLLNRKVFHKKVSRTWFDEKHYQTEAFKALVSETKYSAEKEIDSFIKETFLDYKFSPMYLTLNFMVEQINKTARYKVDKNYLKNYLKKTKSLMPIKEVMKCKQPIGFNAFNQDRIEYKVEGGRPYQLHYEDWLTESEQQEYLNKNEFMKKVHFNSDIDIEPESNDVVEITPPVVAEQKEIFENPDEEFWDNIQK
jgi:hypothetical protein